MPEKPCNVYIVTHLAEGGEFDRTVEVREDTVEVREEVNKMTIFWNIGVDTPITPKDPLPELPEIPRGAVLVIGGRAPIWRYGMAFHAAHGSPAVAVATFDPRLGAVVVASHSPEYQEGDVLDGVIWQK